MFFESQVLIAHVQKKHGVSLVDYQVMKLKVGLGRDEVRFG
jgi:hypothetical protein